MDESVLQNRYIESRQRFDYFMTGLTTAVLAYSVQSVDLGTYKQYVFLAPIAWVLLLLAILAGIVRMHYIVEILQCDPLLIAKGKELKNYQGIATRIGKGSAPENETNTEVYPFRPYNLQEIENLMFDYEREIKAIEHQQIIYSGFEWF